MHEIKAVGHRVLHGGTKFSGSVLIDDAVIAIVEAGVLLSMRAKLDKITNDYNQIQERLENS